MLSKPPGATAKSSIDWNTVQGLFENLLAALFPVVTTVLIRLVTEGELSTEDIYVALGIFFPLLIVSIFRYRAALERSEDTTRDVSPPLPQPSTASRGIRVNTDTTRDASPPLSQLFRGRPLGTNLLLAALSTLIIPVVFHLLTGRNVLLAGLLFAERDLSPSNTVDTVFGEETGAFLVDSSPMLQIGAVSYAYANGSARNRQELQPYTQWQLDSLPVEQGQEGWKIRLERLLEQGLIQEEDIPFVPQEVKLVVHHLRPSDNPILIYVITDEIYPQQLTPQILPFRETLIYQNIYVGQSGLLNFIDLTDFSVTLASSPNIVSPGVGPVAAIVAVEFEGGEPILRSNVVFVMRRGILHPRDVLFGQDLQLFISQPLDAEGNRMIAFQSPEPSTISNDIMISGLDGSGVTNIAPALFSGSEEVICGWGSNEQNRSTLYFLSSREGGNIKVPYKVIIADGGTVGRPIRLTTPPLMCGE